MCKFDFRAECIIVYLLKKRAAQYASLSRIINMNFDFLRTNCKMSTHKLFFNMCLQRGRHRFGAKTKVINLGIQESIALALISSLMIP